MSSVAMGKQRMGCILSVFALCAGLSLGQNKPTLAVMDLSCSGVSENDATALTGTLSTAMARTRSFGVVTRAQRDQVLQEWGFSRSAACGDTGCLLEAGRYLHVQKIVGGSIVKSGQVWTVDIRLLDVKTEAIDMSFTKDVEGGMDGVLRYLREAAEAISRSGTPSLDRAAAVRKSEQEQAGNRIRFGFNLSGGLRIAHDRFTASQTITAPGYLLERNVLSENRGGYCLETGVTCTGLWRFAPICFADYFFDRSTLKSAPAAQYLRSRGLTIITGLSYALDLSFVSVTALAGAGYEWESLEQQNGYFGGLKIMNNAPAAAAGLCLDSPLFMGIWTTLRYKYLYTRCSSSGWSDQDVRYTFTPRRERHVVTFGIVFKP